MTRVCGCRPRPEPARRGPTSTPGRGFPSARRSAIATAFETRAADDGGGSTTVIDTCRRTSPRRLVCGLRHSSWENYGNGDTTALSYLEARASAMLRADGLQTERGDMPRLPIHEPKVSAETDRRPIARPGGALRIRARIGQPGPARVEAQILLTPRLTVTLSTTRDFRSAATWRARLALPPRVVRAAGRRNLEMWITVTVDVPD